ncbi:amidohydrolase [Pseudoclavibacter endophyticus]|nr:amidohydrolase [Pseudoclavibacter endophyticus]
MATDVSAAIESDNGERDMNDRIEADFVVRGAKVFTAASGELAYATGFAVRDGVFAAVVADDAELAAHIGPNTVVRDLDGAPIVPGLFDDHIHHVYGGRMLTRELQLSSRSSLDEVLAAVDAWAEQLPDGAWIIGSGWGSTLVPDVSRADARRRLDEVSHGHPALLSDDSHHNAWANTAALVAAGIPLDGSGELIEGTVVDRETGETAGVFFEHASAPLREAHASSETETLEDRKGYVRTTWKLLHSFGITGIQDAGVDRESLDAIVAVHEDGDLKGWVSCCLGVHGLFAPKDLATDEWDRYARQRASDRVRTDFTKLAVDGVPPTQTAGMIPAYLPTPEHGHDHHGLVYYSVDELTELLRGYRAQGRSTKIHCAGDWGVRVAMDAFEVMRNEGSTLTYQIAHGQFVAPEDRRRMAQLDVVAEISPFIWYPGVIPQAIAAVLPEDVASKMQPNRELLDLGVLVAGGSDWSVVPTPNAWEGIGGLVTREDPLEHFPGQLWAEQAVTVEEALRIFTINGAKAARLDDVIGSIEVGKAANFVVIDRDPFTVDPRELGGTKVVETVVAGETVYLADVAVGSVAAPR